MNKHCLLVRLTGFSSSSSSSSGFSGFSGFVSSEVGSAEEAGACPGC